MKSAKQHEACSHAYLDSCRCTHLPSDDLWCELPGQCQVLLSCQLSLPWQELCAYPHNSLKSNDTQLESALTLQLVRATTFWKIEPHASHVPAATSQHPRNSFVSHPRQPLRTHASCLKPAISKYTRNSFVSRPGQPLICISSKHGVWRFSCHMYTQLLTFHENSIMWHWKVIKKSSNCACEECSISFLVVRGCSFHLGFRWVSINIGMTCGTILVMDVIRTDSCFLRECHHFKIHSKLFYVTPWTTNAHELRTWHVETLLSHDCIHYS